jgi:hypothetical protein
MRWVECFYDRWPCIFHHVCVCVCVCVCMCVCVCVCVCVIDTHDALMDCTDFSHHYTIHRASQHTSSGVRL